MPHLEKMKRLVKLLLDTSTDFLLFFSFLIESSNVSLRQSGIEANIDGVAMGSFNCVLIGVEFVKPHQTLINI